jgi:uncharacterized repeat protein (TIGR03803 family)
MRKTMRFAKQTFLAAAALAVVLGAVVIPLAQAQTFTLLHTFSGAPDGAYPLAGFVQDAAGNLYGTTQLGGITTGVCGFISGFNNINGCGTIFKIDTTGVESVLYRFTGGTDGEFPASGLVIDGAGNLYGTTSAAVFKLDTAAKFSTLHGPGAYAGLVMDAAGILYGSSADGIFSLDPSSLIYTVLAPGVGSNAPLALDAAGNLYGTTGCTTPCGTVFELDTSHAYSTLYTFPQGPTDGFNPISGVIVDSAGNLFGTTLEGGALNCGGGNKPLIGCGTVFKLTPSKVESVFSLQSGGGEGANVGLVQDLAGKLYGSAEWTGPAEGTPGVLFKIDPNGVETVLFTFSGGGLGRSYPMGSLALDSSGNIYGTTYYGGSVGAGTAFKLNPTGAATYPLTIAPSGTGSGTVTGNISGIACPSSCAAFYSPGTVVTLTAAAATGSAFTSWGVNGCSGTSTCNVTTSSAETVVFATFDLDFSLSASVLTPAVVSPGGMSTSTISVTAASGFSGSVSLTCAVTPTPALAPTCLISPTSAAPGTSATLTVNTTAGGAAAASTNSGSGLFYALCLPVIGLVVCGIRPGKATKRNLTAVALVGMLLAGMVLQIACGGSSTTTTGSKGTPTGKYTVTVTGTDSTGALVHNTPTTLTVQ